MTENSETQAIEKSQRDPGRWMALYLVIVAVLAVTLDGAMMGLIAPEVAQDLGANAATIGLISSMSMLMLAAFILGDIYGRKRFLSYGLIGATITSVLAMLVPGAALLIPGRALAGVMAALFNPLALRRRPTTPACSWAARQASPPWGRCSRVSPATPTPAT